MKTRLRFYAVSMAAACAIAAQAGEWVKALPKTTPITNADELVGDSLYFFNTGAGQFLTEGNDWGTRASVGSYGNLLAVLKAEVLDDDGNIRDGKYYELKDSCYKKGAWKNIFTDQTTAAYVDMAGQNADYKYFEIEVNADGTFRFCPARFIPAFGTAAGFENNYYGTLSDSVPTVVFPLLNPAEATAERKMNIDWAMVTQKDYAAYLDAQVCYDAAMSLKEALASAVEKGVTDTAAEQAVYDNTNSTTEQLNAAVASLNAKIAEAFDPNQPEDYTSKIVNPDIATDVSGWSSTTGAQNKARATNQQGDFTDGFYENWNPTPFEGKMYQTIKNLPNGVYKLKMAVFTQDGNSKVYLYGNNDSVLATSTTPKFSELFVHVDADTLELGIKQVGKVSQWMGLDNASLTYYGGGLASYRKELELTEEAGVDFDNDYDIYSNADFANFEEAKGAADQKAAEATDKAVILEAIQDYLAAYDKMYQSAETYKELAKAVETALEVANEKDNGELQDLADEIDEAINQGEFDFDEATAKLNELLALTDAVRKMASPGEDVTALIANPNFDEQLKGWTADPNLGQPVSGGDPANLNVERWNQNFDFYQELTDVPNGAYELKVQAFYRTESNSGAYDTRDDAAIMAQIYANNAETNVPNLMSQTFEDGELVAGNDGCWQNPDGTWTPNTMTTASFAFNKGAYECTVVGVVLDGKLRLGIRSLNGSNGDRWTIWDNFRLKFLGADADALAEALNPLVEKAQTLLDAEEPMETAKKDALQTEIDNANAVTDGRDMMKAFGTLTTALEEAQASITGYANLNDPIMNLTVAIQDNADTADDDVLAEATELFDALSAGLAEGTIKTEEIDATLNQIKDVIARLNVPAGANEASDENPVDMTKVIVNPDFDEETGWTLDAGTYKQSASNGEIYEKDGSFYQVITGLPAGTYKVACQGFNRGGWAQNVYDAYLKGTDKVTAKLFANNDSTALLSIYTVAPTPEMIQDGDLKITDKNLGDLYVPNSIDGAAYRFADGLYADNEVITKIEEGQPLTIGINVADHAAGDWTIFDHFTLTYYGTNSDKVPTAIGAADAAEKPVSVKYYGINGVENAKLVKGVNIIKATMADGTVKVSKVIVK